MTAKNTLKETCHECHDRDATHWRRYEVPQPSAGVVHEFYLPYCDECPNKSTALLAAPKIPLSEVMREPA